MQRNHGGAEGTSEDNVVWLLCLVTSYILEHMVERDLDAAALVWEAGPQSLIFANCSGLSFYNLG